jgi:hypothetical protein
MELVSYLYFDLQFETVYRSIEKSHDSETREATADPGTSSTAYVHVLCSPDTMKFIIVNEFGSRQ